MSLAAEDDPLFATALASLPSRHRRVIELRLLYGQTYQAIALALGFQRQTTARALCYRALRNLQRRLAELRRAADSGPGVGE